MEGETGESPPQGEKNFPLRGKPRGHRRRVHEIEDIPKKEYPISQTLDAPKRKFFGNFGERPFLKTRMDNEQQRFERVYEHPEGTFTNFTLGSHFLEKKDKKEIFRIRLNEVQNKKNIFAVNFFIEKKFFKIPFKKPPLKLGKIFPKNFPFKFI